MTNLLELQDLYNESLTREVLEKTKSAGLVWNHLGGTQFSATSTEGSTVWDFYVTKTQTGNVTYQYTLDIKKDSVTYITLQDGPLVNTDRESMVKELYEVVEIIVLEMDKKLKEGLQFVQNITDCRDA